MTFPIITNEKQNLYSNIIARIPEANRTEYIPEICGIHGKACRQMGKIEGANRALCNGCSLAEYCKILTVKDIPLPENKIEVYTIDKTGMLHILYEGTTVPANYEDCIVQHFNINGNGTTQIRIQVMYGE